MTDPVASDYRRVEYRPDIDGLRAIAVGAVLLFHADVTGFSGGFVGVDVFFVISGFLITRIILTELDRQTFSLKAFYERRVRRIFPALFAMMLVCLAAGARVLLPTDLHSVGISAIATTVFSSNFYFWQHSGYFAAPAELHLLLHTWSLAVEEQFYILYPVVFAVLYRTGRRRVNAVVLGGLCVSLAASVWAVGVAPTAAFYLAPTRAWELLVGAVLALGIVPQVRGRGAREFLAGAGMLLIGYAVLRFSDSTPFPGLAAVVPCVGSALVIHAGARGSSRASAFLGCKPLVFGGLISYPLYLWHWPILALCRHYYGVDLPLEITAVAYVITFLVAIISWRFIERPFRERRALSRIVVFRVAGAMMIVTAVAGGVVAATAGRIPRYGENLVVDTAASEAVWRSRQCMELSLQEVSAGRLCLIGDDIAATSFLLWGDSHAWALRPAVEEASTRMGRSGLFAGWSACIPLIGVERTRYDGGRECREFNDAMLELARSSRSLHTVIMVGRWALSAEGHRYKSERGATVFIADDES